MARIRSTDTKPELLLRDSLRASGVRYRTYPDLPGRPDIALGQARLAVFVHGCFWHRCPRHFSLPATRTDFWRLKIGGNVERDRRTMLALRERGWRSIVLWECQIEADPRAAAQEVLRALAKQVPGERRSRRPRQKVAGARSRSE